MNKRARRANGPSHPEERNNLGVPEADAKQAFGSSVEQLKTQGFLIQVFCSLKKFLLGVTRESRNTLQYIGTGKGLSSLSLANHQ